MQSPSKTVIAMLVLGFLGSACATPVETCFNSPADGGSYECSLKHDGMLRTFRVHLPTDYDPSRPVPLVFAFHGGIGTGKYMERHTQLNDVANKNYFAVVYPDGFRKTWNAGDCCEHAMRKKIDDVGFVNSMIDSLSANISVDSQRIYATGFSNGSMLAHRLACELSDRIAAIAAVSGVIMVSECTPDSAMSVLVIHGTEDPRSLWNGGLGDKDPSKGIRDSIPATMARLHKRYDCGSKETTFLQKNAVNCSTRECSGGTAVVGLCRIEGAGHQWPGVPALWPRMLGPANQDISASQVIWEFFAAHPKRTLAL